MITSRENKEVPLMNEYDDWAHGECDYCNEDRKIYLQEELKDSGEPLYYCDGEDCKSLQYLYNFKLDI